MVLEVRWNGSTITGPGRERRQNNKFQARRQKCSQPSPHAPALASSQTGLARYRRNSKLTSSLPCGSQILSPGGFHPLSLGPPYTLFSSFRRRKHLKRSLLKPVKVVQNRSPRLSAKMLPLSSATVCCLLFVGSASQTVVPFASGARSQEESIQSLHVQKAAKQPSTGTLLPLCSFPPTDPKSLLRSITPGPLFKRIRCHILSSG